MKQTAGGLSEWSFEVDEVSAGVYRVHGTDKAGRSVQFTGTDPDAVLEECKKRAARIIQELHNDDPNVKT
jgi:hypothetical protein